MDPGTIMAPCGCIFTTASYDPVKHAVCVYCDEMKNDPRCRQSWARKVLRGFQEGPSGRFFVRQIRQKISQELTRERMV